MSPSQALSFETESCGADLFIVAEAIALARFVKQTAGQPGGLTFVLSDHATLGISYFEAGSDRLVDGESILRLLSLHTADNTTTGLASHLFPRSITIAALQYIPVLADAVATETDFVTVASLDPVRSALNMYQDAANGAWRSRRPGDSDETKPSGKTVTWVKMSVPADRQVAPGGAASLHWHYTVNVIVGRHGIRLSFRVGNKTEDLTKLNDEGAPAVLSAFPSSKSCPTDLPSR